MSEPVSEFEEQVEDVYPPKRNKPKMNRNLKNSKT